ncbi:MAG: hypothetical protein ACRDRX_17325 [Pseudonocardiaceae bacterium]
MIAPSALRHLRQQAQERRWHADQRIIGKAYVAHLQAPADDLAVLVQPGGQHRGLGALCDLLHQAEQVDGEALDIAPPVLGR